ncbi:MAG: AsmA family protein [Halioglobus sp.]
MKVAKTAITIVIILGLLIAVAAYYVLSNLDGFIKDTIETVGTEVTGTRVSLESVNIDLGSGTGTLSGLVIDNPPGYDSPYAFSLDKVTVGIQPSSLTKPVIVISQVSISGANIIAEQKGTKVNLSELLDNVNASAEEAETDEAEPAPDETPSDIRLMMQKFVFTNTNAKVITETKGEAILTVPDVTRTNIGDSVVGLTPEQLGAEVTQAVVEEVEEAVQDYLEDLAKAAMQEKIKEKTGVDLEAAEEGLKSFFK